MEGWVTLHRKFLQWEWFDKPEMVQLFIYLLLMAQHGERKYRGVILQRGELVTSIPKIMNDCKLSEQQARTCIKRLKSTGEITCKATNKYTIITICNYDRYQDYNFPSNGQTNGQTNGQATDKQRTSNGHNINNNVTIKQCNNINNNNLSVYERACTREEREKIFELFFFKNFINPEAEVDKFYANYDAQGWVRGNGQKIVDVMAVAKAWQQGGSNMGQRFPMQFLVAMKPWYDKIAASNREEALQLIKGIVAVNLNTERLLIACLSETHNLIGKYGVDILHDKLQVKILGQIITQN
jgi:hypothetical protein